MPNPTSKSNPVPGTTGGTSQNVRGGREENIPSGVRSGSQRPGGGGGAGGGYGGGKTEEPYGGSGQAQRHAGGRDPSQRVTSKPDISLGATSETSILRTCANTCYEAFVYGIREGGKRFEPERLLVLIDAAETCGYLSNMVARGSEHADAIRTCCADIVKAAEELCEEFQDEDELFKACADVARECHEHLVANA